LNNHIRWVTLLQKSGRILTSRDMSIRLSMHRTNTGNTLINTADRSTGDTARGSTTDLSCLPVDRYDGICSRCWGCDHKTGKAYERTQNRSAHDASFSFEFC
jgi:hypothetical protein